MKHSKSFVMLPSAQVAELAERAIESITRRRERRLDALVDTELLKMQRSRLRKLFRRPSPTREEAMKRVNSIHGYNLQIWNGYTEQIAYELLNAARAAPEVYITTEELARVWKYGDRNKIDAI